MVHFDILSVANILHSNVEYFVQQQASMDPYFKGKRVLVTGAGKGIGRALSVKLTKLGASVVALSRTRADLENLKAEFPSIEVCQLDIQDWDMTRETVEQLGHFDLLVNNAGITKEALFLESTKEDLDSMLDVNFKAVYNITQVVTRSMVARGTGGTIVNVSSVCSLRAFNGRIGSCTTKAALDMLTMSLALELGPHKIRVNSVNPSLVMTPMGRAAVDAVPAVLDRNIQATPLRKLAEEEDIVNAIVFLLSDKSAMINGVIVPVDGGFTVKCV